MHDFDVTPQRCVELVDVARQVDLARLQQQGLCYNRERHGLRLSSMARMYLKRELAKDDDVRKSDWSRTLSEEQLECEHG